MKEDKEKNNVIVYILHSDQENRRQGEGEREEKERVREGVRVEK